MMELVEVVEYGCVFLTGVVGGRCLLLFSERKKGLHPKGDWKVVLVQAVRKTSGYDYTTYSSVEDEVAIRLERGKQSMTIKTIKLNSTGFETLVDQALTEAEQKAMLLNAHMSEYH
jgi:hypothetical protein